MFASLTSYGSLLPLGPGQQLRVDLPAPVVTQAVLPVCAGVHWPTEALVLYAETHSVWDQLRSLYLLPVEPDCGGSGGIPLHTPWGEPDEVPWSNSAEDGDLLLHTGTGSHAVDRVVCSFSITI